MIETNICIARPSKSKMEEKCGILFKTVKSERYIKGFQLQKQKTKKERETEREKNEIKLPPFLFI